MVRFRIVPVTRHNRELVALTLKFLSRVFVFHANIPTVAHWAAHAALCPQTNPETTIDSGKHVAPSGPAACKTSNNWLFLLPVEHGGVRTAEEIYGIVSVQESFCDTSFLPPNLSTYLLHSSIAARI
ncbi:hypothetical protein V1477_016305 [Vespula maculifrons]|uniref:Uncharacterized protein n=1 Tax=Vespula maculifrons TaxID=7453 RepID=A0ABD2BCM4_VESMC